MVLQARRKLNLDLRSKEISEAPIQVDDPTNIYQAPK